jgi:LPXTG-motif cell wall-anchored protein
VIDTSNNTVVDTITVAAAPIIPKMAPLESASDSVDVVVASTNSSDLDSLADTGQNTTALSALAVLLLTVGTISYGIVARKKQLQ